jgi:hypothetical protein
VRKNARRDSAVIQKLFALIEASDQVEARL